MEESSMDRRRLLKMVGLSAALGAAGGCSVGRRPAGSDQAQRFLPVQVSPERVIRTVVGLRPYRPSGFVLRTDEFENKIIIHNYGHGGAGVTLSWGVAAMAVEEALKTGATGYAVLGCGVIGLSTARLLQRRGFQVTIYAMDLPPETTSNVAGAIWFPVSVYDPNRAEPGFRDRLVRACRLSHRIFQDFVGGGYGVWWIRSHTLFREPPGSPEFPGGNDLYPEIRLHRDEKVYFGFPYAQQYHTMMIEPAIYLNAVLRDFRFAGGNVLVRQFDSREDVLALPERVILNCTGLGARALFRDEELVPVKGQLSILLPQPEIDYAYVVPSEDNLLYMFPRNDGIVLGGTTESGNSSLEPSDRESKRILEGHGRIAVSLSV